jgi:hypothetical protein
MFLGEFGNRLISFFCFFSMLQTNLHLIGGGALGEREKKTSCTPRFFDPQPRCREVVLVLVPHPHCYALSQNRNPRMEHANIIIIKLMVFVSFSAAVKEKSKKKKVREESRDLNEEIDN